MSLTGLNFDDANDGLMSHPAREAREALRRDGAGSRFQLPERQLYLAVFLVANYSLKLTMTDYNQAYNGGYNNDYQQQYADGQYDQYGYDQQGYYAEDGTYYDGNYQGEYYQEENYPQQGKVQTTWVAPEVASAVTLNKQPKPNLQQQRAPAAPKQPQMQMHNVSKTDEKNKGGLDFEDDEKEYKTCMYGCIPTERKPRYICLGSVGLFVLLAVILGVLFFPRFPEMKVLDLRPIGDNPFKITGLENGLTKNFTVQLDMTMLISVINYNRYHMKVDSINLDAFIIANITELNKGAGASQLVGGTGARKVFTTDQASVKIGHGDHGSQLFPVKQNVTFFMNFTVLYRPDQTVELKDDVMLNEILQSCNVIDPGNRTMTVRYNALAPIKLLSPIGFVPTFTGDLKINCPFQGSKLTDLVSQLRGDIATKALTTTTTKKTK
jgi:hypothetical protein